MTRPPKGSVSNKRATKKRASTEEIVEFRQGGSVRRIIVPSKNARRSIKRSLKQPAHIVGCSPVHGLVGWRAQSPAKRDHQTTLRSDTIALRFVDDETETWERAIRLLSYPRRRDEQKFRERLLRRARHADLARASELLTGKAYWYAAQSGFVDLPGHIFSKSHHAWAQKQVAKAAFKDVPKEAFASLTVLTAVVPTLRLPPFSRTKRLRELVLATRVRVARALSAAGARMAYVSGGFEVAEHAMFEAYDRVKQFVESYKARHWPGSWKKVDPEFLYVVHVHLAVWAHGGEGWISRDDLREHFNREFDLPYQSWLTARSKKLSEQNAANINGYLRKIPRTYSEALIVEDVELRLRVPPSDLWSEGFWFFNQDRRMLWRSGLHRQMLARQREVEALETTGAAIGFRPDPVRWTNASLLTPREARSLVRRRKRLAVSALAFLAGLRTALRSLPAAVCLCGRRLLSVIVRMSQGPP